MNIFDFTIPISGLATFVFFILVANIKKERRTFAESLAWWCAFSMSFLYCGTLILLSSASTLCVVK